MFSQLVESGLHVNICQLLRSTRHNKTRSQRIQTEISVQHNGKPFCLAGTDSVLIIGIHAVQRFSQLVESGLHVNICQPLRSTRHNKTRSQRIQTEISVQHNGKPFCLAGTDSVLIIGIHAVQRFSQLVESGLHVNICQPLRSTRHNKTRSQRIQTEISVQHNGKPFCLAGTDSVLIIGIHAVQRFSQLVESGLHVNHCAQQDITRLAVREYKLRFPFSTMASHSAWLGRIQFSSLEFMQSSGSHNLSKVGCMSTYVNYCAQQDITRLAVREYKLRFPFSTMASHSAWLGRI